MSLCESPLLIICVLQLPQRLIRVSSVCTQSTLIYVFSSSTLVMLSSHSSKIIWRKSPLSTVSSVKIYEAQITWKSLSNQTAFCSSLSQICVKKKAKSVWGNLKFYSHWFLLNFTQQWQVLLHLWSKFIVLIYFVKESCFPLFDSQNLWGC